MKHYVDLALRKIKKPIEKEMLYLKIEELMNLDRDEDIKLSSDDKEKIDEIIENGLKDYEYIKNNAGKISSIMKTSFRTGQFYGNKNGEGFVISRSFFVDKEGKEVIKEEKYSINRANCHGAIDGDKVFIDVGGNGERPRVLEILDRNLENIIGEVIKLGNSYFVKPIDKKKQSLNIALKGDAIEGQRVAVKLVEQTSDDYYIGEITRIFNHKDDPGEDILWEAFKYGIDDQFSSKSLEQLEYIPSSVRDLDKIGREDLTDWKIFTIDGADTKDIDDALSCRRLANGNYEVGVHIADVSYYVEEGSPLDKDAHRKGNSNYLANKVVPMLPHYLSNGICSLNPYVERLAMSCIMEINKNGEVVNYRITPTVIKSGLKMTYDNVNKILKDGEIPPEYEEFTEELRDLNKIALILRKNKILNGAIVFDKPELKLILDDKDEVIGFAKRTLDVGENLIEELMVLANETVDKYLVKRGYPCLHRVHGVPNEKKLEEYFHLLSAIGIPFNNYSVKECMDDSKKFQELAEHVSKTGRLSEMLTDSLVRCMSRAHYSPINIGHYGQGKDYYCHFTSPIRRYSDLTIHRLVKDCMDNEYSEINLWKQKLSNIGAVTSLRERASDAAEQRILDMKCAEYMEKHIGEEYKATIVGISARGLTVQLDNLVEGTVKIRFLNGNYVCNPNTYTLISLEGKDNYYIGDRILVKVKSTSTYDGSIWFTVSRKLEENRIDDIEQTNQYVKEKAKSKSKNNHHRK